MSDSGRTVEITDEMACAYREQSHHRLWHEVTMGHR